MGNALSMREVFDRLRLFPDLDVNISIKDVQSGDISEIREVSCDDAGNIIIYTVVKEEE